MRYRITAPVRTFNGTVAGVQFLDGAAEVDDTNRAALDYCRRRGYTVEAAESDTAPADQADTGTDSGPDTKTGDTPAPARARKTTTKTAAGSRRSSEGASS